MPGPYRTQLCEPPDTEAYPTQLVSVSHAASHSARVKLWPSLELILSFEPPLPRQPPEVPTSWYRAPRVHASNVAVSVVWPVPHGRTQMYSVAVVSEVVIAVAAPVTLVQPAPAVAPNAMHSPLPCW